MSSDSFKRCLTGIPEGFSDSLFRFSPDVEVPLDLGSRFGAVVACGESRVTATPPSQGLDPLLSPLKGTSVLRLFGAAAFSVTHNPGTSGGMTSLP